MISVMVWEDGYTDSYRSIRVLEAATLVLEGKHKLRETRPVIVVGFMNPIEVDESYFEAKKFLGVLQNV